jgi:PBP1b-binding outer membrane lipoprotein LpoB
MRAPILLLALLLSACANPLKAANPVAQVKPGVQSEAKNPPAVDTPPAAVTDQKAPVPLPDIPPSKKRDHNIEED